jgi:hypothetical protein
MERDGTIGALKPKPFRTKQILNPILKPHCSEIVFKLSSRSLL